MSADMQFEEDDLALYAMGLLAEPEASSVARAVAENPQSARLLNEVRAKLAAFGESSVELRPVPEGSLDRLLEGIRMEQGAEQNAELESMPAAVPAAHRATVVAMPTSAGLRRGSLISWAGWAIAAVLAVAAGKLSYDRAGLHRELADNRASMSRETNELQAELAARRDDVAKLQSQRSRAQSAANGLQKEVAGQAAVVNAANQTASEAARERDALRGTVAAQAGQVAQLASEQAAAQQILAVLQNPAALRVTLKKPSSKAAPTGRATYLASQGTLIFLASNLAPLRANKVYQLWLMPADGSSPIAAGTFAPDTEGNASLIYPHFSSPVAAKGFAVSVENAGGSATPTLPLVLAGL